MRRKIFMSLFTIAIVGAMMTGGAIAYFTDVETSTGNTFESGTIDFVMMKDGTSDPVVIHLEDMKPCDWEVYTIRLTNVGTNGGPVYLHLDVGDGYNVVLSEPEEQAEEGAAYNADGVQDNPINDIENHITVDLALVDTVGPYMLIDPEDDVKLGDLDCLWIPLGWLDASGEKVFSLSFHLQAETGNEYQGDGVTFTVETMMTDHNSPGPGDNKVTLFLENKDGSWRPISNEMWGMVTFDPQASTFNYDLYAEGLQASTSYNLIYFADPWPNNNGALIGTHVTDASGVINVTAQSVDLGIDIPVPADPNGPAGGKIWLIPTSHGSAPMTGWNQALYLFETNLIKYDDTDVP